jgi:hypothetical protein
MGRIIGVGKLVMAGMISRLELIVNGFHHGWQIRIKTLF